MRALQITDSHLTADPAFELNGFNVRERYERVLEHLRTRDPQPELVLFTGDLSHDEGFAVYDAVRADLEAIGAPALVIPGNHDLPDAFTRAFPDKGLVSSRFDYALEGWRFLNLNSQIPDDIPGRLGAEQLERLEAALSADPNTPTLVSLHHPVVPVGAAWLDAHRIDDADQLLKCLQRHEQVKLLLCGHVHHATDVEVRPGLRQLTGPATSAPFKAGSEEFALGDEPPGIRWLHLEPDGSFDTEVEYIA
ncbi:MAG: phosphodiesterase [Halofilum sp. (in: g-proteobacteria)]|nr:phosphodiesterase [Halofilum sp. (in: g-proteobacteria)]